MAAGEDHHREGDKPDNQPQGTVIIADHHIVTDHSPDHDRHPHQQGNNRLPAEAFHGGDSGFLLAFAALQIIFDRFGTVACLLHRLN